ncbi:hypothetical protein L1987_18248 [Smallanthus sonchifolius]|uniref:Uncharacterized protein n=1 Tax=Smallanthus sonchifolius TaxID=185202 RepID=A0ACB9J0P6_9ASTR|nr:hypothetical protein L1987_18248 [Smallanthus sonchifolius]
MPLVTVVYGTVTNGIVEQHVDMLVPSSPKDLNSSGPELTNSIGMHPASNDVLTSLLLALPPQTWSGIKDDTLLQEINTPASMDNLPTLLQEEVPCAKVSVITTFCYCYWCRKPIK